MTTARTRIARIAAAAAVVVSLGAATASPALAQTGIDIGSRRVAWTNVDPFAVPAGAHNVGVTLGSTGTAASGARAAGGAFAAAFAHLSTAVTASAGNGAGYALVASSPDALVLAPDYSQVSFF